MKERRMLKWMLFGLIGIYPLSAVGGPKQAAKTSIDAAKIVEEAEKIRNPGTSHRTSVTVTDFKNGKSSDSRTYESYVNGDTAGLVKFITPSSDLGKKLLIKDDDMWVSVPTSANPIRISPRQKLTGNAAYGDIASINYSKNYTAKFLRNDKYNGQDVYVLDLTAISGKLVTYDKIEYWIDQKSKRPLKAHFMTKSGKILRDCEYTGYKNIMGTSRPSKLVIHNHLNKGHHTTIAFNDYKKMDFPSLMFKKESLSRN